MTEAGGRATAAAILGASALVVAVLCWASEVQATAAERGEKCEPYVLQVCWR